VNKSVRRSSMGDQSAQEASECRWPARLPTSPIFALKIVSIPVGMSRIAGRYLPGMHYWCTSRVGCTQWRGPCFDGFASSSRCGICDAAFLRTSLPSPAFTVWQALAVERVNQKALLSSYCDCSKIGRRGKRRKKKSPSLASSGAMPSDLPAWLPPW
jgi:hypothetical protein